MVPFSSCEGRDGIKNKKERKRERKRKKEKRKKVTFRSTRVTRPRKNIYLQGQKARVECIRTVSVRYYRINMVGPKARGKEG